MPHCVVVHSPTISPVIHSSYLCDKKTIEAQLLDQVSIDNIISLFGADKICVDQTFLDEKIVKTNIPIPRLT